MSNRFLEGLNLEEPKQERITNRFLENVDLDAENNRFLSAINAEETQAVIGELKNKLNQIDFVKLLTTPVGQYYTEIGSRLNADYFLEKAGIPETFAIDPNVKYPPHVLKLAEASGADINQMKDRFAVSLVLDGLAFKGYSKLRNALLPAKTGVKHIQKIANMSDEAKDITEAELRRLETAKEVSLKKSGTVEKPVEDIQEAIFNPSSTSITNDEMIIGGIKYKYNPAEATSFSAVKVASAKDKAAQAIKNAQFLEDPGKVVEDVKDIKEVLPPPGKKEHDGVSLFARGPMSWIRSPQYYAPKVYDMIGDLEKRQATIKEMLWSKMRPFEKIQGTNKAKLVGAVADGHSAAEDILTKGLLDEEGLATLQAWRSVSDEAADIMGLGKQDRVINYLTHVWDDIKLKDFEMPQNLELWIKENKKFLKQRVGAKGYNLDIIKAAKVYTDWVAKNQAIKEFKTPLLEEAAKIGQFDPIRADMTNKYLLNYFGELNKAYPKGLLNFTKGMKKAFAEGTLGWNIPTYLLNATQGPIFGAARIGYGAYINGLRLFSGLSSKANKLKVDNILKKSGVFEDLSEAELKGVSKFWGKLLPKAVVEKSLRGMEVTERLNRGPIYLGAYFDVLKKVKLMKKTGSKRLENWFKNRGIDPTIPEEDIAHKWARQSTVQTQIDFGRGGQNLLSMNPIASTGWMYMNFPFKMGEFIASNSTKALKNILKNPIEAFNTPEVTTTLRMALTGAASMAAASAAGMSADRVVGIKNFIPTLAPMWQTAGRVAKAFEQLLEEQPGQAQIIARNMFALTGLPINSPTWKLAEILRVAAHNKDNTSGEWEVTSKKTGRVKYKVDPMRFILGEVTNIVEPQEEQAYYRFMDERVAGLKKLRGLQNQLNIELQKDNQDKASKIRKEIAEQRRKNKKREQLNRRLK